MRRMLCILGFALAFASIGAVIPEFILGML